jgi:hypothetical protein
MSLIQKPAANVSPVPPERVIARLMRKENFLIALVSQGVIDMTLVVPWRRMFCSCFRKRGKGAAEEAFYGADYIDEPHLGATSTAFGRDYRSGSMSGAPYASLGSREGTPLLKGMPERAGSFDRMSLTSQRGGSFSGPTGASTSLLTQRRKGFPSFSGDFPDSDDVAARMAIPGTPRAQRARAGEIALVLPWSSSLEWVIHFAILRPMFETGAKSLRQSFVGLYGPQQLRKRLIILGVIGLILSPLSLTLGLVYFAVRQSEDVHARKDYLGPRRTSKFGQRLFRFYNELPHAFNGRLSRAVPLAERLLSTQPNPLMASIARPLGFISALLLSLLLILTAIDENVLLRMQLGGRNMILYAGILTGLVGFARSASREDVRQDMESTAIALQSLRDLVHIPSVVTRTETQKRLGTAPATGPQSLSLPPAAMSSEVDGLQTSIFIGGKGLTPAEVYAAYPIVNALFPYRAMVYMSEVASAISLPLVLLFVLAKQSDALVSFVRTNTTFVDGVGPICSLSDFAAWKSQREEEDRARRAAEGYGSLLMPPIPSPAVGLSGTGANVAQTSPRRMPLSESIMVPPVSSPIGLSSPVWRNKMADSMYRFAHAQE